jgi:hypothetical protein
MAFQFPDELYPQWNYTVFLTADTTYFVISWVAYKIFPSKLIIWHNEMCRTIKTIQWAHFNTDLQNIYL